MHFSMLSISKHNVQVKCEQDSGCVMVQSLLWCGHRCIKGFSTASNEAQPINLSAYWTDASMGDGISERQTCSLFTTGSILPIHSYF